MPSSPSSLCSDCNKRAIDNSKYCADHQTTNRASEYITLFDRYRANDPIRALYRTKRWRAVRRIVLLRDMLCQECGHRAATEADHIERARIIVATLGIEEFYNPDRLQGLCHDCHSSKTAIECGFAGARNTQ